MRSSARRGSTVPSSWTVTRPEDLITIDQVIDLARERLDPGPLAWAESGAGQGVTHSRNRKALNALALVPRLGQDVSDVVIGSSFAGVELSAPLLLAPIGALALYDPQDALAAATAAASRSISSFCSIHSTVPWEDVAATAPGRHFFQLYVLGDRSWQAETLDRVGSAGFGGLCVTMDSPTVGRRDHSLESGYRWSTGPDGTVNLDPGALDHSHRPALSWEGLEWICAQTDLPVVVKGVMTATDAVRAVEAGADAIYVSNHGGRMVDHAVSTIEVLGEIVASLPDTIDVAVDSGFTRGAEICMAVALGAKAVGLGRLQCWALAAGGVPGLVRVIEILTQEIETTMANLGCAVLDDLTPERVRWSMPAEPRYL